MDDRTRRVIQQLFFADANSVPTFDPLSISPLIWMDFSDVSTLFQDTSRTVPITMDGQTVLGAADKSGNNYHMAGSVLYKTSVQNGKSSLLYDGATTYLVTNDTVLHNIGTGDFYLVMVDRVVVPTDYACIWSNLTYSPGLYHSLGNTIFGYPAGYFDFIPGTCSAATHSIEVYRESGTIQLLIDGADQGNLVSAGNFGDAISRIGWDGFPGGDYFNGYQMEFYLFNTLPSSSNRLALRNYLSSKWDF